MIVKPGTRLFYATANENSDGINIGEVGDDERYVDVPLRDIPALVRRLREVSRELKSEVADLFAEE